MKKKVSFRISRHQIVKSLSRQRKIVKPTKVFESKKLYKRSKEKEELRKMIKEDVEKNY
ncbi:MAG: hypothetical protein N2323_01450 [candidate division WOR-3 bacterium]|nr:hypothetical protein [candidate division WOR-3 bacterium]MCX7836611.1 hypothetical protein [candidate division WOR-3 bacterium]MDW8113341.1 hypothetical protein [candidate division WOR-3 bacterium]